MVCIITSVLGIIREDCLVPEKHRSLFAIQRGRKLLRFGDCISKLKTFGIDYSTVDCSCNFLA